MRRHLTSASRKGLCGRASWAVSRQHGLFWRTISGAPSWRATDNAVGGVALPRLNLHGAASVAVKPLATCNVAVLTVTALVEAPRLLALFTTTVPLLMVVPPLFVFVPERYPAGTQRFCQTPGAAICAAGCLSCGKLGTPT